MASLKSAPSILLLQTKCRGLILEKEGNSTDGGLGVLGSDETVAEESIVVVSEESGMTLGSVLSGVLLGRLGDVSDDSSLVTYVSKMCRYGRPSSMPVVKWQTEVVWK